LIILFELRQERHIGAQSPRDDLLVEQFDYPV